MKFTCPRCGSEFTRKDYLISHLRRKKVCEPKKEDIEIEDIFSMYERKVTEFKCYFCHKSFTTDRTKKHHEQYYCKSKHTSHLEAEVMKLKQALQTLQDQINTSNSNVKNNYSHCTFNIVNSFGSENLEYITSDKQFVENCLRNITHDGMKNLIEKIHYSQDHPENNNVRVKSLKNDLFEVYNNQKWEIMDKNETLDKMIKKGYRIMQTFYNDCSNNVKEYDMNELDGKIFELMTKVGSKDPGVYFPLRKKVFALVVRNTCILMEGPDDCNDTTISDDYRNLNI